jgi:polyisoprenoid-binding protein YceI
MSTPTVNRTFEGINIPEPGTFVLDAYHTTVGFVARHLMVSKVRGSITEVSGAITIADNPLDSSVEAVLKTASITTGAPARDDHLRGADFLDVENYPEITFRSAGLKSAHGAEFVLEGELTVRGVTRPVQLKVEFDGFTVNPWGKEVVAFTATTEIDREEFGITWNQAMETGGVLVGKQVKIEIVAEAVREG